ncbi:hypothetical protein COV88_03165 [Candidatus Saccharibacteria bacterium CG11_big_fil_rev_8_21_14_0_20_41_19]|nr:hypothetical protein [Candidatus Saccharibacteria bacterium]OIP85564.1 MAG: hypothetical protein AUK57_03625 [Candidatus Saccharibacteria bacterium CG2_30_41_52]PIQ70727.1 MAG: hypothetical protein COV88_03165 [Candidatus Saccharibacteria bacterium CG11_big_fil_rev_8_21_14_0_20_41_19]PIZ59308.1 MAG: hypothetical protein COY18_03885 [Candidatus Saccharibacteria bacterium CG_4_10_14_0_2_um_filter_41_11]PJC29820.1 MAG: hypothetical protein CO052_01420 [Candidatus Saccharibacteria bacterium CG_4
MSKIKNIILTLGLVMSFGLVALPTTVGAINVFQTCEDGSTSAVCTSTKTDNLSTYIKTIVNVLLFVLGTVSVITIIVSGIRYTTSHGEAKAVQAAKDTLMYAVIGLIVAIMSYAVVNFVVAQFVK